MNLGTDTRKAQNNLEGRIAYLKQLNTHQWDLLEASLTLVHEVERARLPFVYNRYACLISDTATSIRPSISIDPLLPDWILSPLWQKNSRNQQSLFKPNSYKNEAYLYISTIFERIEDISPNCASLWEDLWYSPCRSLTYSLRKSRMLIYLEKPDEIILQ